MVDPTLKQLAQVDNQGAEALSEIFQLSADSFLFGTANPDYRVQPSKLIGAAGVYFDRQNGSQLRLVQPFALPKTSRNEETKAFIDQHGAFDRVIKSKRSVKYDSFFKSQSALIARDTGNMLARRQRKLLGAFAILEYSEGDTRYDSGLYVARALVERSTIALAEAGLYPTQAQLAKRSRLARIFSRQSTPEATPELGVAQHIVWGMLANASEQIKGLGSTRGNTDSFRHQVGVSRTSASSSAANQTPQTRARPMRRRP